MFPARPEVGRLRRHAGPSLDEELELDCGKAMSLGFAGSGRSPGASSRWP